MLDKTFKLSQHFTLGELTKTSYKTADGNEPPLEAVENLVGICEYWLEELRRTYNKLYVKGPKEQGIIINHGFRSVQVSEKMAKAGLKPARLPIICEAVRWISAARTSCRLIGICRF